MSVRLEFIITVMFCSFVKIQMEAGIIPPCLEADEIKW
jgi:hypothetical protein